MLGKVSHQSSKEKKKNFPLPHSIEVKSKSIDSERQ